MEKREAQECIEESASNNHRKSEFYLSHGKRLLDLLIAVPALIVLSPIMALTALLVRWRLGSPAVFRQERPGLKGRGFVLFKFRTMTDLRDSCGKLLPDAQRFTPLGRLLRRFSLDELPQLWNVIRGDVSLVGPRPLLMDYLPHYTAEQMRRHDVMPGITGWAQIHGRNGIPFSQRLKLDLWYVEHCSLGIDLKILAQTALKVLRSSGVNTDGKLHELDDLQLHPDNRRRVAEQKDAVPPQKQAPPVASSFSAERSGASNRGEEEALWK